MAVDIERIEARWFSKPGYMTTAHRDIAALIAEVRRLQREVVDWRETALHHQEVADTYRDHANAMARQRDALQAKIDAVRQALSGHPRCDVHPGDDPITCGWKRAVADVRRALGEQC